LIPDHEKPQFFTGEISRGVDFSAPRETFRGVLNTTKGWHPLDKALYFDAKTFLHGLLVVEDKLSMAHGLEARVPFLDHELVSAASRIPAGHKLAGNSGKAILRRALADVLPQPILSKPKQGFTPPDQSWYRGPTMGYIQQILLSPRALERGYFEPAYVRRVVDDHVSGRVNHRLLLWSLLCFEWWCRSFLDGADGQYRNRLDSLAPQAGMKPV
jgi:asparagine synthase (glutamine-hydrolysing)